LLTLAFLHAPRIFIHRGADALRLVALREARCEIEERPTDDAVLIDAVAIEMDARQFEKARHMMLGARENEPALALRALHRYAEPAAIHVGEVELRLGKRCELRLLEHLEGLGLAPLDAEFLVAIAIDEADLHPRFRMPGAGRQQVIMEGGRLRARHAAPLLVKLAGQICGDRMTAFGGPPPIACRPLKIADPVGGNSGI